MYNFLLMDPVELETKTVYTINDMDVDEFSERWESESDDVQELFGWDLPCVLDNSCAPVVDVRSPATKPGTWGGMKVVEVTYEQYIEICMKELV